MKKFLLPESGNFYKANLHSHSTFSDGKLTPAEMKKIYMEEGYSIIAFTDHNALVPHPELAEEGFLPLSGLEIDITEENGKPWPERKTCHFCLIALEPDNVIQPCYHKTKYQTKVADQVCFDPEKPDFERVYNGETISRFMKEGRACGFFVTYNHPAWSMENYSDYMGYHGMHAMEICNFGCVEAGYMDYCPREYDDMLRGGERIFCIGADDNHNLGVRGTRRWDSFGAFTVIKAEKLEYRTITRALEEGNFYASQGPEIRELYLEDGKVHITCSPAEKIELTTGVRRASRVWAEEGESATEAVFDVKPEDGYFRITVTDHNGRHANTNAYFMDEVLS